MRRRHFRHLTWGIIPLAWIAIALLNSMQPANVFANGKMTPIPWTSIFLDQLRHYFWWAVLTPLVVHFVRRWPFIPGRLAKSAITHTIAALFVSAVLITLRTSPIGLSQFWYQWPPKLNNYITMLPQALGVYFLIAAITTALDSFRRYLEKQREAAELEAQLSKAQLSMLRMQLEPHFLFNTLNTIAALVDTRPTDARRMITLIGELLRDSLELRGTATQPLEEELDWIERYLEIQQVRFRDRLDIKIDIEPEALRIAVPTLILQPLVENAIKHGLEPTADCVTIEISGRVVDHKLIIDVTDNGAGLTKSPIVERIGVSNTRQRLATMYNSQASTTIKALHRGVQSTIEIPVNGRHV